MPTPEIKFEVTSDMQAVINDLFSEMNTENEKMKAELKDNKAGAELILKLEAVQAECVRIFQDCKTMIPLHNDTLSSKGQEFLEKWRICRSQFLPKNELIGNQVKAGKLNIPPLTESLKSELSKTSSPQMMALVTKYHGEVTELRGMVQKLWGKVLANHKKMNDHVKGAHEIQKQANPDGAVQSASVSQPPLSSSYGARQQASQVQAANANQPRIAPGLPPNQNAKK